MTELLGINLKETEDELIRDLLAGAASQIDCTGGLNADSPTNISLEDINQVTQELFSNNAKSIAMVIEGQDKFGRYCAEVKSALIEVEAVA